MANVFFSSHDMFEILWKLERELKWYNIQEALGRPNKSRRNQMEKKRDKYAEMIPNYFENSDLLARELYVNRDAIGYALRLALPEKATFRVTDIVHDEKGFGILAPEFDDNY